MNRLYVLTWLSIYIYIYIYIYSADVAAGVDLPADVKKCHFGHSACILSSINALIKHYPQGIPEIGLPPLDKHSFPDCTILDSPYRGPIWLNFRMRDNIASGTNNATITHVEGFLRQPNQKQIVLRAHFPRIHHEATFYEEGRFLLYEINGTGRMHSDFQNVSLTLMFKVFEEYRNNKRYLKVYSLEPSIDLDRWISWRDGIYKENTDVTVALNRIFNENWLEFWNDLLPGLRKVFSISYTTLLNKVFQNVAYDDMFLPDLEILAPDKY